MLLGIKALTVSPVITRYIEENLVHDPQLPCLVHQAWPRSLYVTLIQDAALC